MRLLIVGAPRNTPVEIIDKLNKEIDAGGADPKMKARLVDLGGIALMGSPSDFGKLIVGRDREVGQGDEIVRRQAGLIAHRPELSALCVIAHSSTLS